MKYDNYIFDLYGTLADIRTNENKPYLWQKCAALLTDMGIPYEWRTLKADYLRFVREETEAIADRHAQPEIELRRVFKKLMTPWCSEEQVEWFAVTFRVLSRDYIRLYKDVPDIFSHIHDNGGRVYLLSNAQSCFTVPELKTLGIYDMFDDIFISSDMECAKPDRAFMDGLIRKNKLDIGRSIMIGNDYTSDIVIAGAVGMDSLYIETATSPPRIPADETGATYADYTHRELTMEVIREYCF